MRRDSAGLGAALFAVALLTVLSYPGPGARGASQSGTGGYLPTSWALGVVVPEGAGLQGGGSLRWEEASNVTASLTLPEIADPSGIVYGVMSVMSEGGAVMQAAAGVYPNSTFWLAYSWFIPDINAVPLNYTWVLNGSEPQMAPGASVSMSIYRESGGWHVRLADVSTGASVAEAFPPEVGSALLAGDQEVFALESYTRSPATFEGMGNFTLTGLRVDGEKVVGGFYTYTGWNPAREPVFGVGSAGVSSPEFVTLVGGTGGTFEWGYAGTAGPFGSWYASLGPDLAALLLLPMAVAAALAVWANRKGRTGHHDARGSGPTGA